jgi:hypothetical protein
MAQNTVKTLYGAVAEGGMNEKLEKDVNDLHEYVSHFQH